MPISTGKSRATRVSTRQEAVLITSDRTEIPVMIVDVSGAGFRIEAGETFYAGENILIDELVHIRTARDGDLPAQIRWAQGREAGGEFLRNAQPS